jgi:hypothetical protein
MKKIFVVLLALVLVACANSAPVPTLTAVSATTPLPTVVIPTPTEVRDLPSGEIVYNVRYSDLYSLIISKDQVGSVTPIIFSPIPVDGYGHDVVGLQMFPDGNNIAFQLRGGIDKAIIVTADRNLGYKQTTYQGFSEYLQIQGSQNPGLVLLVDSIEGNAASANIYQMVNPGDKPALLWTADNPFINDGCGYTAIDPSPDGNMVIWNADFCNTTPPGPDAPVASGSTWIYRKAVVSKTDGVVFKFPVNNGSVIQHTDIRDIAWSPDSKKLAYIKYYYSPDFACLNVVDFIDQPTEATPVYCQNSLDLYDTAWSPDGTKIAVDTGDSIYVMDIQPGGSIIDVMGPHDLYADIGNELVWSPDSKWIAFGFDPSNGPVGIYAVKFNGEGQMALYTDPTWDFRTIPTIFAWWNK